MYVENAWIFKSQKGVLKNIYMIFNVKPQFYEMLHCIFKNRVFKTYVLKMVIFKK